MAQQSNVISVLAGDLNSIPSTYIWWFITACNFSLRWPTPSSSFLRHLYIHGSYKLTQAHTKTHWTRRKVRKHRKWERQRREVKGKETTLKYVCVCGGGGGVQPGPERQLKGKELGFLKKIQVRFLALMSSGSQLPVTPAGGDSKLLTSTAPTPCAHIHTQTYVYTHNLKNLFKMFSLIKR